MQPVASWRRVVTGAACGLLLVSATSASAQVASECELRVGSRSVGGSLAVPLAEADVVGYGSPADGLWSTLTTTSGRGWSAEAAVPIMRGWAARVDYTRGHLAVERSLEMNTAPYSVLERTREGSVTVRHLTAAVVHAKSPPGMLCAYLGAGGGVYQFDYRGQRARSGGVFGLGGIEFPVGERSGLGFEIQLHLAHNNYEGALLAETVFLLKPAVVFRVHF